MVGFLIKNCSAAEISICLCSVFLFWGEDGKVLCEVVFYLSGVNILCCWCIIWDGWSFRSQGGTGMRVEKLIIIYRFIRCEMVCIVNRVVCHHLQPRIGLFGKFQNSVECLVYTKTLNASRFNF